MAQLMLVNPRKRKSAAKKAAKRPASKSKARRYAKNPITLNAVKKRRKYRRNPIGGGLKGITAPLMPAATAAVGAIGLDLAWGKIGGMLPDSLKSGPVRHVAKAAGALALGALAGMVLKKDTANNLAIGALTVVLHGAMRETIQSAMPGVTLGEYDDGMNGIDGLAFYDESALNGLGYSEDGFTDNGFDTMNGMGVYDANTFAV